MSLPPLDRLCERLRDGQLSSVELVQERLSRIEADRSINAVVEFDADAALSSARAADRLLRRGGADVPPLCGIPVTVKRTFEVRGFAHTEQDVDSGAPFGVAAGRDAAAVSRLRELGCVVLGRTNAPPRAADIDTAHPRFGRTAHPADSALSPGGSSGGSAAAVAAGHTVFDIGSDVAGSARIPAHFCGVYALRPSAASLSHAGHVPGSTAERESTPMLTVCPITRYATDLRLLWSALRGLRYGPGEDQGAPRIAAALADDAAPQSAEVTASLEAAVRRLRHAGHRVDDVKLPVDLRDAWLLCQQLIYAEEPADLPPGSVAEPTAHTDPMEVALWARTMSRHDRLRTRTRQAGYARLWRRFFAEYAAVLLPVMGTTALPAREGRIPLLADRVTVNGVSVPTFSLSIWCALASAGGLPAVSMPVTPVAGDLPVGLQVVAGPGRDMDLLSLVEDLAGVVRPSPTAKARS